MIDLAKDAPLYLADAVRTLPKIGENRPHVSTLWRWCRKGVRGTRLEYAKLGGRIVTSAKALNEFAAALAAADDPPPTPAAMPSTPRKRSEIQRRRAIDTAQRKLNDAGI